MNQKELKIKINKLEKEWENKIQPLRKELNEIKNEKYLEGMKKFIGKCYKFHNGCGVLKWWLYVRILNIISVGYFLVDEFEEDNDGDIEIKQHNHMDYITKDMDWILITDEEFNKVKRQILSKMNLREE